MHTMRLYTNSLANTKLSEQKEEDKKKKKKQINGKNIHQAMHLEKKKF